MGELIEIEEAMPHLVIIGVEGAAHCIPTVTVQRMAAGTQPLRLDGQEDIDDDMVRGIIREWIEIKGFADDCN